MPSAFRHTTPEDEKSLIEFLIRVFAADLRDDFVNPPLLRWKYWSEREDFQEPRSYVIEKDGRIVAHVGLWPFTVRTGPKIERGVHMIDWAADPAAPGAGVSMLQRLTKSFDFVYSIGGSEMTQAVLTKFGFSVVAETLTWARPIRPWKQMLHHQSKDLRLPLRLARNIWWSRRPHKVIGQGWMAVEADSAEGILPLYSERDEAFFRYLQKCPVARYLAFHLVKEGQKLGFIALLAVREQTRVAGVWLDNYSIENWCAAFHLLQGVALRYTGTSEVVARCSTQISASAASQAGMRVRARAPAFLFRKSDRGESLPLHFQLCDNDSVFLAGRHTDFLT